MERHPRKTQELDLSERLRAVLVELRRRAAVDAALELDVDRVRDVEAVIGGSIPDPWLGILAAQIPRLRDELQLDLAAVAGHTKRAHQSSVQRDFVALGCDDGHLFYGFLRGRDPDRIAIFDNEDRSVASASLEQWLMQRFDLADADLRDATGSSVHPSVQLIRHVRPSHEGKTRVRHAKWGEGVVLAEDGEGPTRKVKAEFPGLGLKVVQARFLEFLE